MNNLVCIIVSFNRENKLPTTIEQCLLNGADHIIIVDNNSNSEVINYLSSIENHNKISILYNSDNVGASKAFKQGVNCLKNIVDINNSNVVFLDDDSYISSSFKDSLCYDDDFIVPKVVNLSGRRLRMNLPLLTVPSSFIDVIKYLLRRPVPKNDNIQNIVSGSFVGLTMKSSIAYNNRELIPEDFFIYFDDVYFTLKLSECGYQGKYIPSLNVIHDTTDERRIGSDLTIYYLFRNAVITHREMTRWWWIIVFGKSLIYIVNILKLSQNKLSNIKSLFSGICDGIKYER
ncbi:glycosyltransferase [Vibrio cincinnatiensis]